MSDADEDREVELWRDSIRWRVKEVARSRGIQSSLQLSERSGVNKNSSNAIWNGTALRIDRDSLGKLCHTLRCTPGDLLEFVGKYQEAERS
jgi:DNA-binding Xre family transcriptional regulator